MSRVSIWAQLEAKPGKEKEVEEFLKSAQLVLRKIVGLNRLMCSLSGKHPGLESQMNTLQTHRVQESCGIPNNQTTVEIILR